jgi:hypothetical protein
MSFTSDSTQRPLFVLDRHSFHSDVLELSIASENKADFEARLQKRRDERLEELTCAFDDVVGRLVIGREQLEDSGHKSNIIDLSRDGSLDRLVQCLAGFLGPRDGEKKAPPAQLPSPERDTRLLCDEHRTNEETTEHSALGNDFSTARTSSSPRSTPEPRHHSLRSDADWDCPTRRYPSPSNSTTLSDPDVETSVPRSPQPMPFGNKRKRTDEDEESRKRQRRENTERPVKVHPEINIKSNPKAKEGDTDGQRLTPGRGPFLSPELEDGNEPRNIQTPDSTGSTPSDRADIPLESVETRTEHDDST